MVSELGHLMSGIMAPAPRPAYEKHVVRPFLSMFWHRVTRRWYVRKFTKYLSQPHGEFHTCKYCKDE